MIDQEAKSRFIRDGLQLYPDARETVDAFEGFVDQALRDAFEARQDSEWANFRPLRVDGSLEFGKFVGNSDRSVARWVTGALTKSSGSEQVWVGLGIYWRPPLRTDLNVVAACHVWGDKYRPLQLRDLGWDGRVLLTPLFRRSERRLVVPLAEGDIHETLTMLLQAVDDALAPA